MLPCSASMFSLRLVMLLQLMNSERKRWFLLVHLNCLLMAGSLGQGNSQVHPQSLGVVTAARFVLWAVTWDSYTPPVKNLRYEREQTPALRAFSIRYSADRFDNGTVSKNHIRISYHTTKSTWKKMKIFRATYLEKKCNLESALCILQYIKIKWIWNGKSRKSTIWLGFNTDVFSVVKVVSCLRISEPSFLCACAQFKNICLAKIPTIAWWRGGYLCWCVPDVSFQDCSGSWLWITSTAITQNSRADSKSHWEDPGWTWMWRRLRCR